MIPKGRITPDMLRKRALELQKLMGEMAEMANRVQLPETLIGHPSTSGFARQVEPEWHVSSPTERMQRVTERQEWTSDLDEVKEGEIPPSEAAQQLQAVSRGMANAVRRIRALEEENRLLREAQLATVQDVLGLQDRMRLVEHRGGSQQADG